MTLYSDIEYPIGISKSYWSPKSRRRNGNGAKTWKIFGYTRYGEFRSKPFHTVFGIKPAITMFKRRIGRCIHCAKRTMMFDEIKRLGFLHLKPDIVCNKCQLESP